MREMEKEEEVKEENFGVVYQKEDKGENK